MCGSCSVHVTVRNPYNPDLRTSAECEKYRPLVEAKTVTVLLDLETPIRTFMLSGLHVCRLQAGTANLQILEILAAHGSDFMTKVFRRGYCRITDEALVS
jgi:hypothetical protein